MIVFVVLFTLLSIFPILNLKLFNPLSKFIVEGLDYIKKLFDVNVEFFNCYKPIARVFSSHPIFIICGALCIIISFFVILRNR